MPLPEGHTDIWSIASSSEAIGQVPDIFLNLDLGMKTTWNQFPDDPVKHIAYMRNGLCFKAIRFGRFAYRSIHNQLYALACRHNVSVFSMCLDKFNSSPEWQAALMWDFVYHPYHFPSVRYAVPEIP